MSFEEVAEGHWEPWIVNDDYDGLAWGERTIEIVFIEVALQRRRESIAKSFTTELLAHYRGLRLVALAEGNEAAWSEPNFRIHVTSDRALAHVV